MCRYWNVVEFGGLWHVEKEKNIRGKMSGFICSGCLRVAKRRRVSCFMAFVNGGVITGEGIIELVSKLSFWCAAPQNIRLQGFNLKIAMKLPTDEVTGGDGDLNSWQASPNGQSAAWTTVLRCSLTTLQGLHLPRDGRISLQIPARTGARSIQLKAGRLSAQRPYLSSLF